jgi:hypothetical protein
MLSQVPGMLSAGAAEEADEQIRDLLRAQAEGHRNSEWRVTVCSSKFPEPEETLEELIEKLAADLRLALDAATTTQSMLEGFAVEPAKKSKTIQRRKRRKPGSRST